MLRLFLNTNTRFASTRIASFRPLTTVATEATAAATPSVPSVVPPVESMSSIPNSTLEETVAVPREMVRFLIGQRGKNLMQLQTKSGGCQVRFDKSQGETENAKLSGTSEQIKKMKLALKEDMEKYKQLATDQSTKGVVQEKFYVDAMYVGMLIGKGGETLKDMESKTGSKIQYALRQQGKEDRMVNVKGTPEQVQAARNAIQEKINELHRMAQEGGFNRRERRNSNDSGAGGERGPGVKREIKRPGDLQQIVDVPTHVIGHLIGKKGRAMFEMQDATGARFEFSQKEVREGVREVVIYGNDEQIKSALDIVQKRVQEVLERDDNGAGHR